MGINLTKGAKINLTKDFPGLSEMQIGLGWDIAKPKGLSGLFGGGGAKFDHFVAGVERFVTRRATSIPTQCRPRSEALELV